MSTLHHHTSPALSTMADSPISLSTQIPPVWKPVRDTPPMYPKPGHFDRFCHQPGASRPMSCQFWWPRSLLASLCFMASEVPHGLPFCLQPSLLSPSAPPLLLGAGSGPCPGLQVAAVGGRSSQNSVKVRWKPTCQPRITGSLDTATGAAGSAPGCMGTE